MNTKEKWTKSGRVEEWYNFVCGGRREWGEQQTRDNRQESRLKTLETSNKSLLLSGDERGRRGDDGVLLFSPVHRQAG